MQTNPLSARRAEAKVKRVWSDAHSTAVFDGYAVWRTSSSAGLHSHADYLDCTQGPIARASSSDEAWIAAAQGIPDDARGESEPLYERLENDPSFMAWVRSERAADEQRAKAEQVDYKALYEQERALADALAISAKDDGSFYASMDLVHQSQHPHCRCEKCRKNRRDAALAAYQSARNPTR